MEKFSMKNFDEFYSSDSDVIEDAEELVLAKKIIELTGKCDSYGIITSFNPSVSDLENKLRWVRLKKLVRRMNLEFEEFKTSYRYPDDENVTRIEQQFLFITDIGLYPLLLLGYRYNQATVIHGTPYGAIAYNVETCKPETTVTKSDMLTSWASLLTLPGTFIMPDNPNDVSIHRSNEAMKQFHTTSIKDKPVDFIPPKFDEGDVQKIWDVIDSGEIFGIISAYQPGCSVLTLAKEHKMLQKDVIKLKYGYIDQNYEYNFADGDGMTLVMKKSLFIPGITCEELVELGKKWNQETVTIGGNGGISMIRVADQKVLMDMEINSMKLAFNFLLVSRRNIPW